MPTLFEGLQVPLEGSVEDGRFGSRELQEDVVDSLGRQGGHDVLDGLDLDLALPEAGAQLGAGHVVQVHGDLRAYRPDPSVLNRMP